MLIQYSLKKSETGVITEFVHQTRNRKDRVSFCRSIIIMLSFSFKVYKLEAKYSWKLMTNGVCLTVLNLISISFLINKVTKSSPDRLFFNIFKFCNKIITQLTPNSLFRFLSKRSTWLLEISLLKYKSHVLL